MEPLEQADHEIMPEWMTLEEWMWWMDLDEVI